MAKCINLLFFFFFFFVRRDQCSYLAVFTTLIRSQEVQFVRYISELCPSCSQADQRRRAWTGSQFSFFLPSRLNPSADRRVWFTLARSTSPEHALIRGDKRTPRRFRPFLALFELLRYGLALRKRGGGGVGGHQWRFFAWAPNGIWEHFRVEAVAHSVVMTRGGTGNCPFKR